MMSTCEDLNIIRKKLEAALGENTKQYFQQMKLWFQLKSTKEEFDAESRKLMTPDQVHLHNEFLLCLFSRCQSLAAFTPTPTKPSHSDNKLNRRAKVKRRNRSDKGSFDPADFTDYIPTPNVLPPHAHEEPLRFSVQELFLPDMSLIFGRMLLSAWELGLEGAEESAAELMVVAVQQFLKNILMALLSRRKGYKLRENRFMYGLGSVVPNPWLRNTANIMDDNAASLSESCEEEEKSEPPAKKLTLDEIEQRAAYEIACSDVGNSVHYPLTAFDLLETLQIHRNLIPSHTVYSVNVERVISVLNHATNEEMEAAT